MVKLTILALGATLMMLGVSLTASAADLKDRIKVDVKSTGDLHPGMPPGLYVCAGKHFHIRAMVKNESGSALAHVRLTGKAYGPDKVLLGTATGMTMEPKLAPGATAPVDLEFLTITGSAAEQVSSHELTVVEAPTLK